MPFIAAGAALVGGYMQGKSAEKSARIQADAQTQAAQLAAEEARFRPIGVTTGFGSSRFTMGDDGRLSEASYELTPELQAIRDRFLQQAGAQGLGFTEQGLGAAQGLFNLGQGYLAQTPEQAAQQYMSAQQAALAPSRQQAMSGLMNRLAQTGTQGLGVAQAGGGMANPLAQAFANAQAQQDLQLAAQAQEQGRAQTTFGQGLLGGAFNLASGSYAPFQTQLQQAQGIESLGQGALDIGAQLGGRNANPTGANALYQGGNAAAASMAAANAYNPMATALQGIGQNKDFTKALSGMMSSGYSNPLTGASLGTWSNPSGVTAGSQQDQMLRAQMYG